MSEDDDAWFAPKPVGFGSGLPIAWQGWVLLLGYIGLVTAASFVVRYTLVGYFSILAILTAALLVITARKTAGGWRWRSGGKDQE